MDLHESARDRGRGAAGHNVTFDMTTSLDPFRFVPIAVSGWMNQQQLELIARAGAEDDLEGVPEATLGPDRGRGFLHDRSLDRAWVAAVHRAVLDGAVDTEGEDRWHRPESEWVVDEPDRAQSDGRGGHVTSFMIVIRCSQRSSCRRSPIAV